MIVEIIPFEKKIEVKFIVNASLIHNFSFDKGREQGETFLKNQIRPSKIDENMTEIVCQLIKSIVKQNVEYKTSYNITKPISINSKNLIY